MSERVLIAENATKAVYRDGDKAIKVFSSDFPKSEVLNEALNTARVEETGLKVSKIMEVSLIDGKWALTKEFIEGKTLDQMIKEDPENAKKYIEMMVDIQVKIQGTKCPLLNRLKEKLTRQISDLDMLTETEKYELLTRLDGMPKHMKLCHGDFEPKNIIIKDGEPYVIDWVHAAQGNASADAARTYLLLSLDHPELADLYLDTYCAKTKTKKSYVQTWLPIVAAAQLSKKKEEEKELLTKWVGVCEYQ